MILDAILFIFQGIVTILLSPLSVINVAVEFISHITILTNFLQIIFFVLPIANILPLIILSFALVSFRSVVSLIKTIWALLPIL